MKLSNETKIYAIRHYHASQSAWVLSVSDPEYLMGAPDGFMDDLVQVKMQLLECAAWLEEYAPCQQ